MRKELVLKMKHNSYTKDKYYFHEIKKPININKVDTEKIVLSNKTPYGKKGANKYYIGYIACTGIRPLHIIIKNITV